MEVVQGLTVAEIVALSMPGLSDDERKRCRVTAVTPKGTQALPQDIWATARPREGVRIVIRVVPGDNALRSILTIVVSVAAIALGNVFGPALAGALGVSNAAGAALVGLGVTTLGNLLVNALIPPPQPPEQLSAENRYTFSGWKNRLDPNGAVPQVLGFIRYAPPFAALTHSEIVGDWQYIRAMFTYGYGPLEISEPRIGETPITEYDEIERELATGLETDDPIALMPRQVLEKKVGAELTYLYKRDELGNPIEGQLDDPDPRVRATGSNAAGASVILFFTNGLVEYLDDGSIRGINVLVRIEQRLANTEDWEEVTTLDIHAGKLERFFRQHTWNFPERGFWEIRVTRLTPEQLSGQISDDVTWAALQTLRPEYPINFDKPIALDALRIKATAQINGQLDDFNAMCKTICLDWDIDHQQPGIALSLRAARAGQREAVC